MLSRLCIVLLAALLALSVPSTARSQVVGDQNASLEGVDAVDAQLALTWRDAITKDGGMTETQYEQQLMNTFRSTLEQGGVQLSAEAPNYLYCSIAFVYNEETGLVSAAQTVEYHVPMSGDQWAILWMQSRVYAVGISNFEGTDDGNWCASEFIEGWRAGNTGR